MTTQTSRVGREKILDIAEGLFTELGFRSVSIRDIAGACGVTNAALYYHFENKEALFAEVLESHAARMSARMQQAATSKENLKEQVTAMLAEYISLAGHRRSPLFLLRHRSEGLDHEKARKQHARLFNTIIQPLEDVLAQAVALGEIKPLPEGYSAASLLLGMLHGMGQHRRMCHQEAVTVEDVRVAVDVLWNGMRGNW